MFTEKKTNAIPIESSLTKPSVEPLNFQVHHLTDDEDYRMHVNEYRQSRDVTTEQSLGGSNTDTSQDLVSPSSLGRQTPQQQGHAHVQQTPRFLSVNKKPRQSKRDNSLSIQMGAPGGVEDGDTKNALVMKAAHLFKNRRSTIGMLEAIPIFVYKKKS